MNGMEATLARSAASQLVSAVQALQAAIAACDQNNHECRMVVERVVNRAPIIRDILKEARHFEDKELNKAMAQAMQLAVDAVQEATMVVYQWLAKSRIQKIGSSLHSQPALRNAKERLDNRMDDITAYQTHRIDRRAEQMVQQAGRYDDISRIFEGLLSGNKVDASKEYTVTVARAQLEQAKKRGQALRGHTDSVDTVAWSPDGNWVATASDDHTCAVWDTATGQRLKVLEGHTNIVYSIAWSPDGSRVATAASDKTCAIWDAAMGERLMVFGDNMQLVRSIAWSPDSSRVATGSRTGTGAIWDAATGQRLKVLEEQVRSVTWSPDGSRVATGSLGHTCAIWDTATGQRLMVLEGHTEGYNSIAWSPDGFRVATASGDNTGAIWDTATGQQLRVLRGHTPALQFHCLEP